MRVFGAGKIDADPSPLRSESMYKSISSLGAIERSRCASGNGNGNARNSIVGPVGIGKTQGVGQIHHAAFLILFILIISANSGAESSSIITAFLDLCHRMLDQVVSTAIPYAQRGVNVLDLKRNVADRRCSMRNSGAVSICGQMRSISARNPAQ